MAADDVNLYNPHDGLTGRDGGPYLDQEERRLAEIVRAAKEDRDPDFEKAPATAGTPLVTAGVLVNIANPASNPSQENADPFGLAVNALADSEDFPVNPHSQRPKLDNEKEAEKREEDENDIFSNPSNATLLSKNEDEDEQEKPDKLERDKTAPKDEESVSSKKEESDEEKAKAPQKSTASDKPNEPVLKASRSQSSRK